MKSSNGPIGWSTRPLCEELKTTPPFVGWAPLVRRDRGPPPFGDCGSVVPRHRALVERAEGRRPTNWPDSLLPGWHPEETASQLLLLTEKRYSQTSLGGVSAQRGGPKTLVCEGEGTQGPQRRGATGCCRVSRQLQACCGRPWLGFWSGGCFPAVSNLFTFCGTSVLSSSRPARRCLSSCSGGIFLEFVRSHHSSVSKRRHCTSLSHFPPSLPRNVQKKLLSTLKALSRVTVARCLPLPERRRPKDRS